MDEATALDNIIAYYCQGDKMAPANMFIYMSECLNANVCHPTIKIGAAEYEFYDLDMWFKGWSIKRSKTALFNSLVDWLGKANEWRSLKHSREEVVTKLLARLDKHLIRFIVYASDWIIYGVKMAVENGFGDPLSECLEDLLDWEIKYPQITLDWIKLIRIAHQTHVRTQKRIEKEKRERRLREANG